MDASRSLVMAGSAWHWQQSGIVGALLSYQIGMAGARRFGVGGESVCQGGVGFGAVAGVIGLQAGDGCDAQLAGGLFQQPAEAVATGCGRDADRGDFQRLA